jgi:hypothetical protein
LPKRRGLSTEGRWTVKPDALKTLVMLSGWQCSGLKAQFIVLFCCQMEKHLARRFCQFNQSRQIFRTQAGCGTKKKN